jgi:hypothetical protein
MVDLLEAVPPDLIVVDAITATHKGGELSGQPVESGALIIGTNPVAVDAVCAVAYGLAPSEIGYLQLAAECGYGSIDPAQIQVLGDLTLDGLKERAKQVEHVDPYPDHYPLPYRRRWHHRHRRAGEHHRLVAGVAWEKAHLAPHDGLAAALKNRLEDS